ncbi:hypothetical protein PPL_10155 [Heterostelium album PN500]|uniref:Inorganic phosphate transporter n=1 Tax=Heterostelium pallidum (strain ATCC 26659 / Pp 5 / PN500) TaxID=670386 RepID=D3BQH0_HETP5|nr:hypothetical protein PPL_10155 [Heterostelium album PN500]EFA76390.1 hypothetical protein PPL_10155 [Heterostelium album PN500]|eukprot:XP_020428522.1 hypothetical protein PPL_10155 [Heterostelium album PN500]
MNFDFIFVMGALFLVQKIDFKENPQYVNYAIIAFCSVQFICVCAYAMIFKKITSRPKTTVLFDIKTPASFGQEEKTERMTVEDYDFQQIKKVIGNVLVGICIPLFLLYKWNIVPPLAINCVMALQNLYKNKLFKIYILGEGDNKYPRPFADESPFASLMGGFQPPAEPEATSDNNGNIRIPATPSNNNNTTENKAAKKQPKKKIVTVDSDDEDAVSDDDTESRKSPTLRRKKVD